MDDTLLADSDTDTLEKMFNETQKEFTLLGTTDCTWKKIQKGNSINYLKFKLSQQKNSTLKGSDYKR